MLSELKLDYSKITRKFTVEELSEKTEKDLAKLMEVKDILSNINYEVYRKAILSVAPSIQTWSIWDKLKEITDIAEKVKELFKNEKKETRTSLMRPASPGVSIGHYLGGAGTFGAVVYDRKTGDPSILSNTPVFANTSLSDDQRAKVSDSIVQPATGDGNSKEIGKLAKYAALNSYPQGNQVDCALAKPLDAKDINPEILEIGTVKGAAEAVVGMKLRKSGRTTGLTSGEVTAIGATIQVNYGEGRNLLFENQIVASKMSEPGDSGSLVLDLSNNAVGLLFAGSDQSTIINPINPVLDILGVQF